MKLDVEPDETAAADATAVPTALRWVPNLVTVILAAVVATVWWARDRGFDLTDEGYYLQLYAHPGEAPPNAAASQYYRLVDTVAGPFGFGAVGFRVLGLLILLFSGAFLGFAVYRFAGRYLPQFAITLDRRPAGVAFVALAGLLGYSWAPLAVGYNTLAVAMVQIVAGSVLLALAMPRSRRMLMPGLFAVGGALIPFLFYVKWPTAVALLLVMVGFALGVAGRRSRAPIAVFVTTAVVVFGLVTDEIAGGPFSLGDMFAGLSRLTATGYEPLTLLRLYLIDVLRAMVLVVVQDPWRVIALMALFSGSLLTALAWNRSWPASTWLVPALGGLFLLVEIPGASYLDRATDFKFVVAVFVALGLTMFVTRAVVLGRLPELSIGSLSREGALAWSLGLLLVSLPLIGALGSNSHVLVSSLHGGAAFGAAMLIALAALRTMVRDGDPQGVGWITLPVLALIVAAQVVNGVALDPYRLTSGRYEQSVAISGVPQLEGMRFDEPSARFLEEVQRVVSEETSFLAGDRVLGYATVPGLVYMIDGIAPGALWVLPAEGGRQGEICAALRSSASAVAATTLLLQNSTPSPELEACMTELIPGYPDRFREAGRVPIPDGYGAGQSLGTSLTVYELTR